MPSKVLNRLLNKALIIRGKADVKAMIKRAENAKAANEKTLFEIIRKNENCEYGKKYDFANIHTVEDFQKKVPIVSFDAYEEYTQRIFNNNEQNLLFSDPVVGFSVTSGSTGKPKAIPLTNEQVLIYTKYTVTRMMYLADQYWFEKTGKHFGNGYGLSTFEQVTVTSPHGLPATNIVDIPAKKIGWIYPLFLDLPIGHLFELEKVESEYVEARFGLENRDILFIFAVFSCTIATFIEYIQHNWQMLCDDIEKGIVNDNVFMADDTRNDLAKVMKPNPERAAELRREFEKGFDDTILSRIWPNMKFLNCIGTSPTYYPYTKEIMKYAKDIPIDYSIYGASEGLIAAAYKTDDPGLMMLLDSAFYEFIEQGDEIDESKVLTVDQLEVGKEYEIIITTRSGLYRYRFGDVIKVLKFEGTCPIINFSYRKGQLVSVAAEKTTIQQMVDALDDFQKDTGLKVDYWSITESKLGRGGNYLVLFESKNGTDFTKYEKELDTAICTHNARYELFRGYNVIEPLTIKNLKPGSHEEWRQKKIAHGASPNQVKPVTALDTEEKREFFLGRVLE